MRVKSWKFKRQKLELLSHKRKHCSWSAWNASSAAPPLIPRLLDITEIVTSHICMLNACIQGPRYANWKQQSWPETRWIMLAQACVGWPIRADCVFGRRGLKETGVTVRTKGHTDIFLSITACKYIRVVTQSKMMKPESEPNIIFFKGFSFFLKIQSILEKFL